MNKNPVPSTFGPAPFLAPPLLQDEYSAVPVAKNVVIRSPQTLHMIVVMAVVVMVMVARYSVQQTSQRWSLRTWLHVRDRWMLSAWKSVERGLFRREKPLRHE